MNIVRAFNENEAKANDKLRNVNLNLQMSPSFLQERKKNIKIEINS